MRRQFACLTLALVCSNAFAQNDPNASATARLVGLWGTTRSFGPEIRGELTIARAGDTWRSRIGGTGASVRMDGDSVFFELAAEQGAFRGQRAPDRIRGLWIQPRGRATGVAWATPVELEPLGTDVWRGTVTPLEETVTLYLDVRAEADGTTTAVLRNPDGYYRNGRVNLAADGSHLKLIALGNGPTLLEGDYDAQADRVLLPIPELGTTLELTRQTREQAIGYFPRTPAEPNYVYHPPIAEADGWPTASLGDVGLDEARVTALVQKILDVDPRLQTSPLVQGLLVTRHGKLVLEEYFYGFHKERRHDLRSGGKTFASVLAGIAIDRGAPFGPQTPVYSLFPEYAGFDHPDPRKQRMTVEHLMTMTSGFDCDENGNENAPGNEDKMQGQTAQPDWYKFMLDQPMAGEPGDAFTYCTGAVNLMGGILRNTTRTEVPELFDRDLAQPLHIQTYHMNLTPKGQGYLGGGLHIRPRDVLKLGQLYLDGGVWHGKRIVSQAWVDLSTAPHPMNAKGTDGYNWHLNEIKLGDRVFREYDASGNGGQFVMVVPELDLVVEFTAGNYNNFGVWRHFRDELLPQYILAAVKDLGPAPAGQGEPDGP